MTRITISEDEMFPVYSVGDKIDDDIPEWAGKYNAAFEVDDETLARWNAASVAFEVAQNEMMRLFEAAKTKKREQRDRERVEAEKQRKAVEEIARKEREQKRQQVAKADAELRQRLSESDGVVYDSRGNTLGVASTTSGALQLNPVIER